MDETWLDTVRIARDCGNISSLFPPGITRLWDLPHTLFTAIRMALYFLSFEQLQSKDQPPQHIWLDQEKMEEWWAAVKRRQEDEMKGNGAIHDMPQNSALKEMFPGVNFG